jgi:hypothetical protein
MTATPVVADMRTKGAMSSLPIVRPASREEHQNSTVQLKSPDLAGGATTTHLE